MRNILLIFLAFILFGCPKTAELKIEINLAEPLDKNNTKFKEFLKESLAPIASDSITYIPIIKINRIDKDTLNTNIIVPISSLNNIKKSLGTYTYKEYEKDYQDYLKTLKLPTIVNLPEGNETSFNNEKQFNFFEDSLNLDGNITSFISTENLFKAILQKSKNKTGNISINYHLKKLVVSDEKLDSLLQGLELNLSEGKFDIAIDVANELNNSNNTINPQIGAFSQKLKLMSEKAVSNINSNTSCSIISSSMAQQTVSIILDQFNSVRVTNHNNKIKQLEKNCPNSAFYKIFNSQKN